MQLNQAPAAGRRGKDATSNGAGVDPFLQGHRPLFSYQRYADQEPLDLSVTETACVVAVVLGPDAVEGLLGTEFSALLNSDAGVVAAGLLPGGKPVEVRCSIQLVPATPWSPGLSPHAGELGSFECKRDPAACC